MTTYAEREFRRQAWQRAHPTIKAPAPDPFIIDMPEKIPERIYNPDASWSVAVVGLVLAVALFPLTLALLIWGWWDDRRSLAAMRTGRNCLNAQRGEPCLTYGMTPVDLAYFEASIAREHAAVGAETHWRGIGSSLGPA